jgi:hypothetical protein
MREFRLVDARLRTEPVSITATKFGYPGAMPSVSSDGSRNGIVWASENGGEAVLHAYDANDLAKELYNSNEAPSGRDHFGGGNKFITPMIAHGKVYVGTTDGVGVFGCCRKLCRRPRLASSIGHVGVRVTRRIGVQLFDWICRVPPNCRKRSRIPRSPSMRLPTTGFLRSTSARRRQHRMRKPRRRTSPKSLSVSTTRERASNKPTLLGYGNDSRQTWPHRHSCLILKRLSTRFSLRDRS